eukprot:824642-Amphidinium_carterae.1
MNQATATNASDLAPDGLKESVKILQVISVHKDLPAVTYQCGLAPIGHKAMHSEMHHGRTSNNDLTHVKREHTMCWKDVATKEAPTSTATTRWMQ